ncbi:UDP-3-O-acyl-N-acetylglucosamine deacetylase [Helicobacter canadensis]|uniref:UDP-3-O-acyl-N-acetylglucosamine deacetylase n=1 Tax=Helicobacter canadensis MIT 98-5491 TaxID=537970 RepID=C5ZW30_9HELI|nr:UDP-3-O-acyl-N-acetylglucosamine deacetylase [Helicobacter canadensis]EES88949.1 UDP-3-O-[3-hydroxymyristoyl] N-acetylglucosamine deacetylase [Helicobacter canadensis MIT 98-5491]EFR48740.1 UDP-3-O-[3-hydroxymyristoyl] N-acetylglucosamine deacetylase [Helicobacter canadensis MIT 98-5491]STP00219.1 UDP-3-O-[3-hydroxymyristoyl] N-acetylglucosamine deacetylase [Helicobacter canadensis]
MRQQTLTKPIELVGIGLHKGVPVKMRLEPLEENSGIHFFRSDVGVNIPLKPDNVVDTTMATVIAKEGHKVSTIEHLLSAVHAYGIDNLRIVLDNEEVPIMDGSSIGYCMLLEEAGITQQNAPKKILKIKSPIEVKEGDKFVRLEPSKECIFDFSIHFPHPVIGTQNYKFTFSTHNYKEEIARARTFGFLSEVQYLRSKGLALGGSLDNAIVLDETTILNKDGLRYKEEFVRHKILDAIGDMCLLGIPLLGTYVSYAGSHKLNHLLTKKIFEENSAYEIIQSFQENDDYALAYQNA